MRKIEALEASLVGAAALFGSAGLALVVAEIGWARVGLVFLVLATLGAIAAGVWLWWRRGGITRTEQALQAAFSQILAHARLAESLAPELGSAPTSAVDLGRQLNAGPVHFSRELAEAHIHETAKVLAEVDLATRLAERRRPRRRYAAGVLGASVLLLVVMTVVLDKGRARLLTMVQDPSAARLSDVPLAGDIRISYRYPAYTGLPPRVVEGGDGSINAVAGTEVEVFATTDQAPREATLRLRALDQNDAQDIPMSTDGRKIKATFAVLRDGRYHFALTTADDERLEDRQEHAVRAVIDTFPEIYMDAPTADVQLKDNKEVTVLWRARDDFGVAEVNLVIESPRSKEPKKLPLSTAQEKNDRLEGRYRWSTSDQNLPAGGEVRFFLEAIDNDVITGPKRSVSAVRRLVLFSATANHQKNLAKQQEVLEALVDWLGAELVAPFPTSRDGTAAQAFETHTALLERITKVSGLLSELITDLRDDKLAKPEYVTAFDNVQEHVNTIRDNRRVLLRAVTAEEATNGQFARLSRQQKDDIAQLERDVIYLDDLLAMQRIDELKATAKDLLAAQRELRGLLDRYKESQDPALRAELEERIKQLRQQMLEMIAKMASIKERLPGEYRNLEAASMLQVGDQLNRLEKMLQDGDLEGAAAELEQLANMLENMADSIDKAEEEYGGERYAALRAQLNEFAQQFRELEDQQQALAKRTSELLGDYRKKAIERAGKDLDDFVKRARGEVADALGKLDEVADVPGLYGVDNELSGARQRLFDLDTLLEHKDFAVARDMVQKAQRHEQNLEHLFDNRLAFYGQKTADTRRAARALKGASESTDRVAEMLEQLFPEPNEVLTPQQMAQMQRIGQKQQNLEQRAAELGQKMDELSKEMPLFGGEPKESLESAKNEMGQAADEIEDGQLPRANSHEERAVSELAKLRQALEQAAQKSGGRGIPLPLGGSGQGQREGGSGGVNREDVEIPKVDPNRKEAKFREALREAAKQKPPEHFEEAVKRYYRELIR